MYNSTNSSATSPAQQKFVASIASKNYKGPSINDFLKLSGYANDPTTRMGLAKDVGMTDYSVGPNNGEQNLRLMELLRNGGTGTGAGTSMTDPNNFTGGTQQGVQTPTKSASDLAFESYLSSLSESPEEKTAREYVSNLITQSKLAREKAQNSGETMGYAMGETARVQRNNDLTIDSASEGYKVLKDGSTRRQGIEKLRYERQLAKDKELRDEENARKPFELSAGQSRYEYNPTTKKYEVIAARADKPTTKKVDEPSKTEILDEDINNVLGQLQSYKEKNNHAGVDETLYNRIRKWVQSEHGVKGVQELDKGLAVLGLEVDLPGDGKGYR